MDEAASIQEPSLESQLVRTLRYIDIYLQQKTDLFLQSYVFEPVDYLLRQIMFLSIIVTLLAAGTAALVLGVILLISTLVPLWAALLMMGITAIVLAGIIAYILFSKKIILNTPVATGEGEHG